ncbi:MAG: ATP-dependent protease subunit HslV, partial [Candidatus Poribacteria bacterium]
MKLRSTTIVAVRRDGEVAIGGDGQVTLGDTVMKHGAVKVRRMYEDKVLTGFAGSAADALALFEKLEGRLEEFRGALPRAAVELAKDWRSDRALRRLEAQIIACDAETSLLVSGSGDVLTPDDGVVSIGSGASIALGVA